MTKLNCRYCTFDLSEVKPSLDLGELYPSNFITESTEEMKTYPLTLVECPDCGLVQLTTSVDRNKLYRQYWYRSGINSSMRKALKDIALDVDRYISYNYTKTDKPIVVDIGCNDGTMLGMVGSRCLNPPIKVGFDPAKNLAEEAEKNCDIFVNDFFSFDKYWKLGIPNASVITAIAMFYDLEDVDSFVEDVTNILDIGGIFIIQLTDLTTTLKINAIDNVCHEHLEYYSLNFLSRMARDFNLSIEDVSFNTVNGGSMRVTFSKKVIQGITAKVVQELVDEYNYYKTDGLKKLDSRIKTIAETLTTFLKVIKRENKTIAVMGASTKGNTLLQYFGIDNQLIDHAAEVNKEKFGLKTVGTNIPIISEEESLAKKPDYYLVLPWHFIDNFIEHHMEYLMNGGMFVVPLPIPRVYWYDMYHRKVDSYELS